MVFSQKVSSAKRTPKAKDVLASAKKSSAAKKAAASGKSSAASKKVRASSRKPSARKFSAKKNALADVVEACNPAEEEASEHLVEIAEKIVEESHEEEQQSEHSSFIVVNPDFAMDVDEEEEVVEQPLPEVVVPLVKETSVKSAIGFVSIEDQDDEMLQVSQEEPRGRSPAKRSSKKSASKPKSTKKADVKVVSPFKVELKSSPRKTKATPAKSEIKSSPIKETKPSPAKEVTRPSRAKTPAKVDAKPMSPTKVETKTPAKADVKPTPAKFEIKAVVSKAVEKSQADRKSVV